MATFYKFNTITINTNTTNPAAEVSKALRKRAAYIDLSRPAPQQSLSGRDLVYEKLVFQGLTSEQEEKSERGLISGIAESVVSVADALRSVPMLGSVPATVSTVAGAVGGIARFLGFAKPLDVSKPMFMQPVLYNASQGRGIAMSTNLAAAQEAKVHPLKSCLIGEDEMSFAPLLRRKQLICTFDMLDVEAGSIFFSHPVHPLAVPAGDAGLPGAIGVLHTISSHVANLFQLWRGSMEYELYIFASSFHSARIRISWIPTDFDITRFNNVSDLTKYNVPGMVVDIRGNDRIRFSIPYMLSEYYARCSLNEICQLGETLRQTSNAKNLNQTRQTYGQSTLGNSVYNGSIVISIENELTFPASPIPAITFALFQSCGPDMQLKQPTTASFSNAYLANPVSGESPIFSKLGTTAGNCYGECYGGVTPGWNPVPALISKSEEEFTAQGRVEGEAENDDTIFATTVEKVTTFEEVGDVTVADEPCTISRNPIFPIQEVISFVRRPVPIFRHRWKPTDDAGAGFVIDPLSLLLRLPSVQKKIANYRYMRADVVVKVRINGTKFHYGAWAVSAVPMGAPSFSDSYVPDATWLSGFNGGMITPDSEETFEIRLPYIYNRPYFPINNIGVPCQVRSTEKSVPPNTVDVPTDGSHPFYVNNGMLYSYALTQLRGSTVTGSATVSPISIVYFAHLENVELEGFTDQEYTFTVPPSYSTTVSISQASALTGYGQKIDTAAQLALEYSEFWPSTPPEESAELQAQGYTYSEDAEFPPIIPCTPAAVSDDVIHGDHFSSVKELIMRPTIIPLFTQSTNSNGYFISYHHRHRSCINKRDFYRGANTNVSKLRLPKLPWAPTSWLDAFAPLYLATRGSFRISVLANNAAYNATMTNRTMWCIAGAADFADTGFTSPVKGNVNAVTGNPDMTVGSASSWGANIATGSVTQPLDVTIPWYSNVSFAYIPKPIGTDSLGINYYSTPSAQTVPGVTLLGTAQNIQACNILVSGGDDFQMIYVIPPQQTIWSPAYNATSCFVPTEIGI